MSAGLFVRAAMVIDRIIGTPAVEPDPLPVEPPELEVPDEHEESRPADIDDCVRCEGHGMFVAYDDGEPGWRVCGWCSGTGQRDVA